MSIEKTLSIIKPDAVKRDLTGKIIAMFEEKGLRVIAQKKISMTCYTKKYCTWEIKIS